MSTDPDDGAVDGGRAERPPAALRVHKIDIFVSAAVLLLCAVLYAETYSFARVPESLAQNVQPAVFPRLVLIVMMIFALMLPFEHHRNLSRGIDLDEERSDRLPRITWMTAGVLVLFVAALPTLGALPALILIALVLPVLWGERRWKILIPFVLIFPASLLFLFVGLLKVSFPPGITGGLFY